MRDYLLLIIIPICMALMCYAMGILVEHFSRKKWDPFVKLAVGCVSCAFVFQILAFPFMLFALPFQPLYIITLLVGGICLTGAGIIFVREKKWAEFSDKLTGLTLAGFRSGRTILLLLLIFLIVYQVVYVVCFQHADADDSYYVAEITTTLQTGVVQSIDPASGIEEFAFSDTYRLVGYEVLMAVLAKLFSVNVAFFMHTVLPVFFIPLHYVVIYLIGNKLREKKGLLFVLLYCVINLFSAYTVYSQGAFLLYRIWQGKAVFINIVIPILICGFIQIYKNKKVTAADGFVLTGALYAAAGATTVGIYLAPIAYFAYTVSYLLCRRNLKETLKLCVPVVCFLPLVVTKLFVLRNTNSSTMAGIIAGADGLSFYHEFAQRFLASDKILFVVFLCAFVMIAIKGCKYEKMAFLVPPLVLVCTFVNPFAMKYVARYVSGADVYWRLFWLLEIPFVIAMGGYLCVELWKTKWHRLLSLCIVVLLIGWSGNFILDFENFTYRENRYKISAVSKEVVDTIHREVADGECASVLVPEDVSYGMRQYCGDIQLVLNRYTQGTYNAADRSDDYIRLMNQLVSVIYASEGWQLADLQEEFSYFDVDYVLIGETQYAAQELPVNMREVKKIGEWVLLEIMFDE